MPKVCMFSKSNLSNCAVLRKKTYMYKIKKKTLLFYNKFFLIKLKIRIKNIVCFKNPVFKGTRAQNFGLDSSYL